ncbi:hypothetical protein pb186bvf_009685 [Paramecium bursaria]
MRKIDQTYFKLKPQQASQTSFIKQYQNFLQKTRKVTPIKEYSSIKKASPIKSSKNSSSPVYRLQGSQHEYKPLFNQSNIKTLRQKDVKVRIKSISPNRQSTSFCINMSTSAQKEPILFSEVESTSSNQRVHTSATTIEKSCSSVSIFQESTKQLEELQQQSQKEKPELQKGIQDILSLIKKEKQVILNDMKQMTKQMNKYKQQYEETLKDNDNLKRQNDQIQDAKDISQQNKEHMNDTYLQMINLLKGMSVEYSEVLPELGPNEEEQELAELDKDEIIIIQKLIIKKLVKKIEDTKQLNQLLLTKLKEQ